MGLDVVGEEERRITLNLHWFANNIYIISEFISHIILKRHYMNVILFFLIFSKKFYFLLFKFFNNFLLSD